MQINLKCITHRDIIWIYINECLVGYFTSFEIFLEISVCNEDKNGECDLFMITFDSSSLTSDNCFEVSVIGRDCGLSLEC